MVEHVEEIPQYRRELVFTILMKTLGYKYLPLLYSLFFSRFYLAQKKKLGEGASGEEEKGGENSKQIFSEPEVFFAFLQQLTLKFSPFHALHAFIFLLGNLHGILGDTDENFRRVTRTKEGDEMEEEEEDRREGGGDSSTKNMLLSLLTKQLQRGGSGEEGRGEKGKGKKEERGDALATDAVRKVMSTSLLFLAKYLGSESLLSQLLAMPDTMDKRLQGTPLPPPSLLPSSLHSTSFSPLPSILPYPQLYLPPSPSSFPPSFFPPFYLLLSLLLPSSLHSSRSLYSLLLLPSSHPLLFLPPLRFFYLPSTFLSFV
jgi:hypothetical protein